MKASEWIEARTLELVKVGNLEPLEAKLQAVCELFDRMPPRFGAPHGPPWLPPSPEPPRPPVAIQEIKSHGGIASKLLVTGPNSDPR
jgi:hypothetical protein